MKKSYSLLSCFVLFLLALVLCCKPVKAAEPTVINLSDLEERCYFTPEEDCVLNLDTDKALFLIYVGNNELTFTGNGKVTCNMVGTSESGKLIMDSGSLVSLDDIYGHGSLIVNNGSIETNLLKIAHITVNDGYVSAGCISSYSNFDTDFSIYGGHLESKKAIRYKKIYIDDRMFVADPCNKEPELYDDQCMVIGSDEYGVSMMPKSEVIFLDGITINETSCSLKTGEKKQLSVSFSPENASYKKVMWSSSDPSIATVSQNNGVVEALRPGKAIITATAGGGDFTQTCEITVDDTSTFQDGLVIEASNLVWNANTDQPYIKVKYNGVELKEGSDYVINKETNWDTGLSTTTITGLDEYIRKADKK